MKTTTEEKVMTREQIAVEYFEHNLDMIKNHYDENYLADCKKEEMAVIINYVEQLYRIYCRRIENVNDDVKHSGLCNMERITKLDLIEQILKF